MSDADFIEVDIQQLKQLAQRLEQKEALQPGDFEVLQRCLTSYLGIWDLYQRKRSALFRVLRRLFGSKTESRKKLKKDKEPAIWNLAFLSSLSMREDWKATRASLS